MQERRGYDRLKVDGDIRIISQNGSPVAFKAFLDNISFVGFGMFAAEKIEPETIVEFELTAPILERPLQGTGRIKYVNVPQSQRSTFYTVGVEFVDTNKDIVIHVIKRLQAKMAEAMQSRNSTRPLDFMPF